MDFRKGRDSNDADSVLKQVLILAMKFTFEESERVCNDPTNQKRILSQNWKTTTALIEFNAEKTRLDLKEILHYCAVMKIVLQSTIKS